MNHLTSLQMLVPENQVTIKVPHIPEYNDENDINKDIDQIKEAFGFTDVIKINYKKLNIENYE